MITSVETKMGEGMTIKQHRKAVVLLSGGIDSTVSAYIAREDVGEFGKLYALTFNYGQRHIKEALFARSVGRVLGVTEHRLPHVEITAGSSLTGQGEIPTEEGEGIPSTWVPQRNSIFLALAFSYAEAVGADRVYIGVNSRDYSGYPDCRPEFILAMSRALNLASKQAVETGKYIGIVAPLQHRSKVEIIQAGLSFGIDFSNTWSCYRGEKKACGRCPSCLIRLEAFRLLDVKDPVEYEDN